MASGIDSYPSWCNPGWQTWHKWSDDLFLNRTFHTVKRWENDEDALLFIADDLEVLLKHDQECCENVYLEDINGNLDDLTGAPILIARKAVNDNIPDLESCTWTFYLFATIKGYVTLRWIGSSNGYYSEEVNVLFRTITKENTNS